MRIYVFKPQNYPKIGHKCPSWRVRSRVRVVVLVVTFAIFIFTRPDFRDFLRSISSVQNYNRFLVYLTIYRSIEI